MSILSDMAIEEALDRQDIRIEGYNPDHLNPTSYDVTLGTQALVYPMWTTIRDGRVVGPNREAKVFDPYHKPATFPLTIMPWGLDLYPGVGYLMSTAEKLGSTRYVPILDGKSSVGRMFVKVHETAGYIDPGFFGNVTLEVTVVSPIRLYAGMRIGQVRFQTVEGRIRKLYDQTGHYVGDEATTGPVASRLHQQLAERPKGEVFAAAMLLVDPHSNRVLVVNRPGHPLDFALPCGKLEPGEAPADTAFRELYEETGVEAYGPLTLVHDATVSPGERVQVYTAEGWNGEARTMEPGIHAIWVPPDFLLFEGNTYAPYYRQMRPVLEAAGLIFSPGV